MKVSVIVPAYNAVATLGATLDAVLAQTLPAREILVFDDGSTDDTPSLLETYKSRVTHFRQENQGVAHARNFLCRQAKGDYLAFLDADDIWHPKYLEFQSRQIARHPNAVAWFTEHVNFNGYGNYDWKTHPAFADSKSELIAPLDFVRRYDRAPLSFQMSCFCLNKGVLSTMRGEPFQVSGAEDTFFHNMLPLMGPIVHSTATLSAYRVNESSLSANRLKISLLVLQAFALLEVHYRSSKNLPLIRAFLEVYASRRRNCGKYLMGSSRNGEARKQFLLAARTSRDTRSILKSMALYISSWLPRRLQPQWPGKHRVFNATIATQ